MGTAADFPVTHLIDGPMLGLPQLGTAKGTDASQLGKLLAVIKGCLFDAYNTTAVADATMTYNAATGRITVPLAAGHGFVDYQIIDIQGAAQTEYNGRFRAENTLNDSIEYTPDTTPTITTATGASITIAGAPVGGWQIIDIDTNTPPQKMSIRSTATDATPYTWIIDNSTLGNALGRNFHARVSCAENYVDLDTWDEVFHNSWAASNYTISDEYPDITYMLIADSKMIYFNCSYGYYGRVGQFILGDINSIVPDDQGHAIGTGCRDPASNTYWYTTSTNHYCLTHLGDYNQYERKNIATSYTQASGAKNFYNRGIGSYMGGNSDSGAGALPYPSLPTNGAYVHRQPLMLEEKDAGYRGNMPGLVQPLQDTHDFAGKSARDGRGIFTVIPGFEAIPLLVLPCCWKERNPSQSNIMIFRLDDWR